MPLLTFLPPLGAVLIWSGNMTINQLTVSTIRQIGASQASIFINLMPVFSALIAMAFLGEQIALFHLVGGMLVLAGVIMAQTLTRPLRRLPATPTRLDRGPR